MSYGHTAYSGYKKDYYDMRNLLVESNRKYDKPYNRLMDKNATGKPCPECGNVIQKMQYLGGACYFCPKCQA